MPRLAPSSNKPRLSDKAKADIQNYFEEVALYLQKPDNGQPLTPDNIKGVTRTAGVYALFEGERLRYVGESACIAARLADLFRTRNHTCRRSMGRERFGDRPDYVAATTKRNFPPEIERLLSEYMRGLQFVAVPVVIGRKEIEESITAAHPDLLNAKYLRRRSAHISSTGA